MRLQGPEGVRQLQGTAQRVDQQCVARTRVRSYERLIDVEPGQEICRDRSTSGQLLHEVQAIVEEVRRHPLMVLPRRRPVPSYWKLAPVPPIKAVS